MRQEVVLVFEPAWGGGVNFRFRGEEMWAPDVVAARRFVRRMVGVGR